MPAGEEILLQELAQVAADLIDDFRLTIDDSESVADGAEEEAAEATIENRQSEIVNREELAVRWISYAVGVVLGRFTIGDLRLTIVGYEPGGISASR